MSARMRCFLLPILAAVAWPAAPARATDGPLFLFGGVEHQQFLGCLNCYRSEPFSVWNEEGEYGDPSSPLSIWNRRGEYGSPESSVSPWNPRATAPPLVVDRVGNLYGYFTLDLRHPQRVRRNDSHPKWADFKLLVWLLENYDWIVTHLDQVRAQY